MFNFRDIYLFHWNELYYIEFETEIGLDAFGTLITNLEDSLSATKKKFEDIIKNDPELNSLDDEERGNYYTQIFEREEMTIRELQRQQRYSICLSIFSFFEGRLKFICNQVENKFNFKIKLADLNSGEDLMRYWNYLEKVFEIDITKIIPYFTPLKQQKIVRNIIAHQDGLASEEQNKRINSVTGLNLKLIGQDYQIQINNKAYLQYLLEKMTPFFKELLLAIDKRCKEKDNVKLT